MKRVAGWLCLFILLLMTYVTQIVANSAWAFNSTPSFEQAEASHTSMPTLLLPLRQITSGQCCTNLYWNKESTEVRFIDQPSANEPVGIWGIDITQSGTAPYLVTERLGVYSPDGNFIAYPDRERGLAIIERLADGQKWELDTQESNVVFTPDSQHLAWVTEGNSGPGMPRGAVLWLADLEGSNVRAWATLRRSSPLAWLSDDILLIARQLPGTTDNLLFTLSLSDGVQTELIRVPRLHGLALSPDRRYLVYYAGLESETAKNGTWLLDLQNPILPPQKLPFFGTYRWRDSQHLIYIPFDPNAVWHIFYEYSLTTQQTRLLFPEETTLRIANNDWQVSPDGQKIAFLAANGSELNGIWVIDIPTIQP